MRALREPVPRNQSIVKPWFGVGGPPLSWSNGMLELVYGRSNIAPHWRGAASFAALSVLIASTVTACPDADGDGILDVCQLEGLTWSMIVSDQWAGGFVAELHIANHSQVAIESWLVGMHVDFVVDGVWSGTLEGQMDGVVEVSSPPWNTTLDVGQTLVIGFQATGSPTLPSLVTVNGATAQPE
jgi:hypothetical protein